MSLAQRTIALAEGRQLEDLARLLESEQANCWRCPLLSILDPDDDAPALAWLDLLRADRFAWVVLLTGEGLRRLLTCAERHDRRDDVIAALSGTQTITRGPKPVRALKEIGLSPTRIASAPTTDGVIASLADVPLENLDVGVQLYRPDNPPLTDYLASRQARVHTVLPYVYAPASAAGRVVELIGLMQAGSIDALVFTSAPQVDRLLEVAQEHSLTSALHEGMARTKVAAVGPLVADRLKEHGLPVDVCPEQGWQMKNLVVHLRRALGG